MFGCLDVWMFGGFHCPARSDMGGACARGLTAVEDGRGASKAGSQCAPKYEPMWSEWVAWQRTCAANMALYMSIGAFLAFCQWHPATGMPP